MEFRGVLFGDLPLAEWPPEGAPTDEFPWNAFAEARAQLAARSVEAAKRSWRDVLARPGLEPRHYLQAWHFLREHGEQPPEDVAKQVLGLVVEMALPAGLDLLAVYADRSARYYNRAGAAIVLDRPEPPLAELIDAVLAAAADVVARIGPWEGPRRGPPPRNHTRLSFLTPSGVHFGEGPTDTLENDPLGGLVLKGATAVMTDLVALATPTR